MSVAHSTATLNVLIEQQNKIRCHITFCYTINKIFVENWSLLSLVIQIDYDEIILFCSRN